MGDFELIVRSNAFGEGDWIPLRYTARGENVSPDFQFENISSRAKSIAITMDDASHPIFPDFNHWVIWNIPVQNKIPEGIPAGAAVRELDGAAQGIAYGINRYKGPKPPLKSIHTYVFTFYMLDCMCVLPPSSRKADLLKRIEGHILQEARLTGKFQNRRT